MRVSRPHGSAVAVDDASYSRIVAMQVSPPLPRARERERRCCRLDRGLFGLAWPVPSSGVSFLQNKDPKPPRLPLVPLPLVFVRVTWLPSGL